MMATEPITATDYEWQRNIIANRLHLLALNSAGTLRAHASLEAERDRVRGMLADLTLAWEATLNEVCS